MAEYIDKQALITEIQSSVSMVLQTAPYEKVWFGRFVDRQNEIMAIIERQPTAEVEPVTFTKFNHCRGKLVCGNCGWTFAWSEPEMPYCCPFCGARMDLGGADNG